MPTLETNPEPPRVEFLPTYIQADAAMIALNEARQAVYDAYDACLQEISDQHGFCIHLRLWGGAEVWEPGKEEAKRMLLIEMDEAFLATHPRHAAIKTAIERLEWRVGGDADTPGAEYIPRKPKRIELPELGLIAIENGKLAIFGSRSGFMGPVIQHYTRIEGTEAEAIAEAKTKIEALGLPVEETISRPRVTSMRTSTRKAQKR